jgi:hypothetical protein
MKRAQFEAPSRNRRHPMPEIHVGASGRISSRARLSAVLLLLGQGVAPLEAAPTQHIAIKNVSMKVPQHIEVFPSEPSFLILWVDVEFGLANIGRHPVILKNFRIYYRVPPGWHIGLVSPGFGSEDSESVLYSMDLGMIAPGQFMHRRQRIGIDPSFAPFEGDLRKVNLHALNSAEYPVVLKWRIDYLVEGQRRNKRWCWMVDYKRNVPRRCPIQPPGQTPERTRLPQ